MKNIPFKIALSLGVSALCLYLATRQVEWDKLKLILSQARLAPVFAGLSISLLTFWLRAVRWQILLNPFQRLSKGVLVRWQIGGLFVNSILPLRMGELARMYWAGHKTAIPKSTL